MTEVYDSETELDAGRGKLPAIVVSGSGEGVASDGPAIQSRTWVGIVANAAAGRGSGCGKVKRLVNALRHQGLRPRIAWTPAERAALVSESTDDPRCRCLAVVGGDGTVAALINDCPKLPVTTLPTGTENLFATHFGLSRFPSRLAATIAHGCVVPIDLGLTQGRRFALMAGFGFDAEVVTRHHEARIARTGLPRPTNRAAYVEPVLRSSFAYEFHPMEVTITDAGREETLIGSNIFVFNLPRYALGLPFAPSARGDDGLLDLVVFRKPGPFHALHYLWLIFRGLHLTRPGVEHRQVSRAIITAAQTVPVQLDGDPGGFLTGGSENAWIVEALPAAINVLVPRTS
jgi:diacylglycerol kinase (ATP)